MPAPTAIPPAFQSLSELADGRLRILGYGLPSPQPQDQDAVKATTEVGNSAPCLQEEAEARFVIRDMTDRYHQQAGLEYRDAQDVRGGQKRKWTREYSEHLGNPSTSF